MLFVLRFFQEFATAGLIAVSPLLIGFLFFSYTQSVSVHFGVTSLTVLLWHVAICLVDITIQLISDVLFLPITTGGLVQTAQNMIVVLNWLHFPFIMAFAFPTVFFYLSVPFVAAALMKGLSGATASLQGGVHGSMQAAGLAIGTGLTVAGAASTFGGSAAAMNQIKLSLRAADDPRIIKEEAGVPLFASVFALRNVMKLGRDETIPLTVKASQDLARTLVTELRKGVSFIVEGQLAYFRNPETNRETYSILADQITDIVPPKSCKPIPSPSMKRPTWSSRTRLKSCQRQASTCHGPTGPDNAQRRDVSAFGPQDRPAVSQIGHGAGRRARRPGTRRGGGRRGSKHFPTESRMNPFPWSSNRQTSVVTDRFVRNSAHINR
jgi:hypothetical protein